MSRADASGRWEPLVGDLLEEIACGRRSRSWVWQQVLGLCGVAFVAQLRGWARITPHAVAAALGLTLLAAASFTSVGNVVVSWLMFYLAAGTASLFGHIMSRATNGRSRLTSGDSE